MNDISARRAPLLNGWRIAGWGSLLALLMLPALAMQITGEVNWTAGDFVFAAVLLGFVGTMVELAVRFARPGAPRIGGRPRALPLEPTCAASRVHRRSPR
jgi:hypothetical protein